MADPRSRKPRPKDTRDPPEGAANSDPRAHAKTTSRETDRHSTPSVLTTTTISTAGEGGTEAERLCQLFLEEFAHLGRRPRQHFERDRSAWLSAASDALADFGWASCAAAIAYLPGDYVLVSSATTMPAFAKVAEKVVARAHAVARNDTRATAGSPDALGWPAAWARLRQAASLQGAAGKQAAVNELSAEDPRFAAFIAHVRWRTICQAGPTGHAGWKQLWESLAADKPTDTEEAA